MYRLKYQERHLPVLFSRWQCIKRDIGSENKMSVQDNQLSVYAAPEWPLCTNCHRPFQPKTKAISKWKHCRVDVAWIPLWPPPLITSSENPKLLHVPSRLNKSLAPQVPFVVSLYVSSVSTWSYSVKVNVSVSSTPVFSFLPCSLSLSVSLRSYSSFPFVI